MNNVDKAKLKLLKLSKDYGYILFDEIAETASEYDIDNLDLLSSYLEQENVTIYDSIKTAKEHGEQIEDDQNNNEINEIVKNIKEKHKVDCYITGDELFGKFEAFNLSDDELASIIQELEDSGIYVELVDEDKKDGIHFSVVPYYLKSLCVDKAIYSRGLDYYKKGKVKDILQQKNKITSLVDGSNFYWVTIKFSKSTFKYVCSCDYYKNNKKICKHVVATILANNERNKQSAFSLGKLIGTNDSGYYLIGSNYEFTDNELVEILNEAFKKTIDGLKSEDDKEGNLYRIEENVFNTNFKQAFVDVSGNWNHDLEYLTGDEYDIFYNENGDEIWSLYDQLKENNIVLYNIHEEIKQENASIIIEKALDFFSTTSKNNSALFEDDFESELLRICNDVYNFKFSVGFSNKTLNYFLSENEIQAIKKELSKRGINIYKYSDIDGIETYDGDDDYNPNCEDGEIDLTKDTRSIFKQIKNLKRSLKANDNEWYYLVPIDISSYSEALGETYSNDSAILVRINEQNKSFRIVLVVGPGDNLPISIPCCLNEIDSREFAEKIINKNEGKFCWNLLRSTKEELTLIDKLASTVYAKDIDEFGLPSELDAFNVDEDDYDPEVEEDYIPTELELNISEDEIYIAINIGASQLLEDEEEMLSGLLDCLLRLGYK